MNPLFAPMIQRLIEKVDLFHLLQVLSGADSPSPEEVGQLITLKRIFSAPVAGDMAWAKLVEFLNGKGMSEVAFGYLIQGMDVHSPDLTKPVSLDTARDSFLATIEAIINNPESTQMAAVCGCPNCGFVFGITK